MVVMVKYSDDFKQEVIAATRKRHEPRAQIARQYGIAASTLQNWLDRFYAANPHEVQADHEALLKERDRLLAEQAELRKQFNWS
ncbi:transposase [Nesterenkonia alkaliphila]|uniref:Transposase n=2 Tax=Nesterenkonia alkaliphila TaxID=1463631 RepID=A0A7K1UG74_9MICC|nr:transposase [Nesterenkonia alkaliphila]GFZ80979.1 hypothetical protein GCM10011359_07010 [Nesterenkonia alkaliphila]